MAAPASGGALGKTLLKECEVMRLDQLLIKLYPPEFLPFSGISKLDSIISTAVSSNNTTPAPIAPTIIELLSPAPSTSLRTTILCQIAATALLDRRSAVLLFSCAPGGFDLLRLRDVVKASLLSYHHDHEATSAASGAAAREPMLPIPTTELEAEEAAIRLLDHVHIYTPTTTSTLLSSLSSAGDYLLASDSTTAHASTALPLSTIMLDSPDIPISVHLSAHSSTPTTARDAANKINADVLAGVKILAERVGAASVVLAMGGRLKFERDGGGLGGEVGFSGETVVGGIVGTARKNIAARVWLQGSGGDGGEERRRRGEKVKGRKVDGWVKGRDGEMRWWRGDVEKDLLVVDAGGLG